MTSFEAKRHIEIYEGYQGINLTDFSIGTAKDLNSDNIVNAFIRSDQFTYDSLPDRVKSETNEKYLRRGFNFEKIAISDFRKLRKDGTLNFLIDFKNESDWGQDREEFEKLFEKYLEIHKQFGDIDFYIISKDWFYKDDEKVVDPEYWCYIYYFIIISVDRDLDLLTLTEWTYD